jgi:hypothetical protein
MVRLPHPDGQGTLPPRSTKVVTTAHKASTASRAATSSIRLSRVSERLGAPYKNPVDQQKLEISSR